MTARCEKCGASAPVHPASAQDIRDGVVKVKACAHDPAKLVDDGLSIQLRGSNRTALIDAADADLVVGRRWSLHPGGYASTWVRGQGTVLMHRLIADAGSGQEVDHINGDRLDNRRTNLRICTRAENAQNLQAGWGRSRHRGVSLYRRTGRWQAHICIEGRTRHCGYFDTEAEAAQAVAAARAASMPFSAEAAR